MSLYIPFIIFMVNLCKIKSEKRNIFNLEKLKTFCFNDYRISALISSLNTNVDNLMISNICGVECLPEYRMHSIITRIGYYLLLSLDTSRE